MNKQKNTAQKLVRHEQGNWQSTQQVECPPETTTTIQMAMNHLMRDSRLDIDVRMTAGQLLLNSSLKLPCEDLIALRKDLVVSLGEGMSLTLVLDKHGNEAYEYLLELRKKVPGYEECPYLYCIGCKDGEPCTEDSFYQSVFRGWDILAAPNYEGE